MTNSELHHLRMSCSEYRLDVCSVFTGVSLFRSSLRGVLTALWIKHRVWCLDCESGHGFTAESEIIFNGHRTSSQSFPTKVRKNIFKKTQMWIFSCGAPCCRPPGKTGTAWRSCRRTAHWLGNTSVAQTYTHTSLWMTHSRLQLSIQANLDSRSWF